jgi:hypothetical protein
VKTLKLIRKMWVVQKTLGRMDFMTNPTGDTLGLLGIFKETIRETIL